MKSSALRGVFGAGTVLLGLLVLLGLGESLLARRALPGLDVEYVRGVNEYVAEGKLPEALRQMRLAAQMDFANPGRPAVFSAMERLAHALKDRESELVALRGLRASSPADADVNARLGAALLSAEEISPSELAEAARACERALAVAPGHPRALYGLAVVLAAQGHADKAKELLREAVRRDPSLLSGGAPRVPRRRA